jgi:hypothetical protein
MGKKKQSVPIRTMGDMVELVNHNCDIFDSSIKKLTRKNRNLKFLCLVAIGCAVHAAIKNQKQEEQIYQLSVRVDKLEHGEGA